MEIRTGTKTLPSEYFSGPEGYLPGVRFNPVPDTPYVAVQTHDFEGVTILAGQVVKLMFKNKRHAHFKVM